MGITTHSGITIGQNNGYAILDCESCGFVHVHPKPTIEQMQDIYPKEYYSSHYPGWIEKTLSEQEYWRIAFSRRFEVFEKQLPPNRRRVLDVGCFLGLFLQAGKSRGWSVVGIEPSEQGVAYGRKNGLDVRHGFFEDFGEHELGKFDVINLSLTLEHVLDPISLIDKAHGLLSAGGLLCIEVPNDFSALQQGVKKVLDKDDYWLSAPHHLNYFNFQSLVSVLKKSNFEIAHQTATFPMEFFLLFGENYLGNDTLGRECHRRRMTFETNLKNAGLGEFMDKFYEFLASQGAGREVLITARKK